VVELAPEICSLDMGSMNMGNQVFMNTPPHLEEMAISIRDAGVTPELEVFEAGHLLLAKRMIETGHIKPPGLFQICLGISWGQPATPEAVIYMRNLLPSGSIWFAFGISLHQFPIAAQTVLLGGHVRVGLGDDTEPVAPGRCRNHCPRARASPPTRRCGWRWRPRSPIRMAP
jgi:3-dehydrocarnitine:acetyl-CoA trimethylamine transferase